MIPCKLCGCLGIVRVTDPQQPDMDSLAYCECEWSRMPSQVWKIPRVNRKIREAFTVASCPLSWFLPDAERRSVPRGQFEVALMDKRIAEWKARLSAAVEFWKQWGDIFDDAVKPYWRDR